MSREQLAIAVFSAVLTATVTLLAVYLTNRGSNERLLLQLNHDADCRRKELLQNKLEELFVLVKKCQKAIASGWLPYLSVMRNQLDYEQALDMTIEGNHEKAEIERIEMLISLYFPTAKKQLKALLGAREDLSEIVRRHKESYLNGDVDGGRYAVQMNEALNRLFKSGGELEEVVVRMNSDLPN